MDMKKGDRIKVKPGREHDPSMKGATGEIVEISTAALGIKFDGEDGVHRWHVEDELMLIGDEDKSVPTKPMRMAATRNDVARLSGDGAAAVRTRALAGRTMRRDLMLPALLMEANLEAASVDVEKRTVALHWYTGATVDRYDFFEGPYQLTFAMQPKNVRLGALNAGAPFKAGHTPYSDIRSVLGKIERAWLENGEGRATVRFSKRADALEILEDIRDGILTKVSMEARILELEDVTPRGAKVRQYLATDWEPNAVALVQIGADSGAYAQALSEQREKFPCAVHFNADAGVGKETDMDEKIDIEVETKPEVPAERVETLADERSEERQLQDVIEADTKRAGRIRELMTHFELDELWAQRHIKLGSSVKAATADARKRVAEKAPDIDGKLSMGADYNSFGWKSERMVEALSARALKQPVPEPARQFAMKTIAECAFAALEARGETRGRALDPLRSPYDVIKLAMTNSDFPNILANVLNKTMLPQYAQATPSFRLFSQRRDFRDYRPHKFLRAGDFPNLLQVGEGAEITQGAMGENGESVTAFRYGRILALTLEVLVNDDVNAFTDFGGMVARRVIDFENTQFYTRVIAPSSGVGPALADGLAVYHSTHANTNSAGALDNTRLGEAWGKMASQTSIDGLKLNAPPKYVLTSATSHVLARTLLASIYPAQASNVNPFAGIMEPIFDANLSSVRYYVLSDPAIGSNYIWGTIGGQGPRFEVRNGFEVEGVQVKVAHDFGCGAVDYRYGVTGAGS